MPTLGSFERINYNLTYSQAKAVKALHSVAYSPDSQSRSVRKHLKDFSGFELQTDSDEYNKKVDDVKKLDKSDLVSICHVLTLSYEGTSVDLVDRICSFLNNLHLDENEPEEISDDEDERDVEEEIEDEEESVEMLQPRKRITNRSEGFSLTFRDVEDSIRPYEGKADYPVKKWIEDFEDIAELTKWNDLQKLIFAKKSLKGLAKLYVQSEKGIKTWNVLKNKLIEEFDVKNQ